MNNENLEYRMYGLVPYNLSPIQQGIQFGHAVIEYVMRYINAPVLDEDYELRNNLVQWFDNDKTFIILNGGTTNKEKVRMPIILKGKSNIYYKGSLNNHLEWLNYHNVAHATFHEPDLGDQLTAVVFLVDERVWNTDMYPDFEDWKGHSMMGNKLEEWENMIGGFKNIQLREWLKQFKLA